MKFYKFFSGASFMKKIFMLGNKIEFKQITKMKQNHLKSYYINIILVLFILISVFFTLTSASNWNFQTEKVCPGMVIRNNSENSLSSLKSCQIIAGSLTLFMVDTNFTKVNYSTEIREITGHLFVYQVKNLITLKQLFPKLSVIRGDTTFLDYSLIVSDNYHLENLGLKSLTNIQNGSILIINNPNLCYLHTINWIKLVQDLNKQYFVIKRNKFIGHCLTCSHNRTLFNLNNTLYTNLTWEEHCPVLQGEIYCWSKDDCQKICPFNCPNNACDKKGACCMKECLGGCEANEDGDDVIRCDICKNVKSSNADLLKCLEKCPHQTYALNRRCVVPDDCLKSHLIPFKNSCIEKCPEKYKAFKDAQCELCDNNCSPLCQGGVIRTIEDAKRFKGCIEINGSLIIELRQLRMKFMNDLTESLSTIKKITGFLKIRRTPSIVSLSFLKNLKLIEGNILEKQIYSMYIAENQKLEKLFVDNRVKIKKGKLLFQLNPMLCKNLIRSFAAENNIALEQNMSFMNGEITICNTTELFTEIEDKNSTAVRVKIQKPFIPDDKRFFIGYYFYYIEMPIHNITKYFNRHGCGFDDWNVDMDLSKNLRHIINDLKPFTRYAYFVQTIVRGGDEQGSSEIQYFHTEPGKPGFVENFYAFSNSTSEIILQWKPPRSVHGKLNHYVIKAHYNDERKIETTNDVDEHIFDFDLKYMKTDKSNKNSSTFQPIQMTTEKCNCFRIKKPKKEPLLISYDFQEYVAIENELQNLVYKKQAVPDVFPKNSTLPFLLPPEGIDGEKFLQSILQSQESNLTAAIDTGPNNFPIVKMVEYNIVDNDKSKKVVPAFRNSFILRGLTESSLYRITIKACRHGGGDNCGRESEIYVKTLETLNFIKPKTNVNDNVK